MPLELADTEESVLNNLAVLAFNGRGLLEESMIESLREEVATRVRNLEDGSTPRGVESAQASRIKRLSKKGGSITGCTDCACVMSLAGQTVIVDDKGCLFIKKEE